LISIEYRKKLLKTFLYVGIPIFIVFGGLMYVGRDQIIGRTFSNLGHIHMLTEGISKVKEHRLRGEGPGSAGPASYQIAQGTAYNPENQYLQIRIEYGVVGFAGWILLYLYLHRIGYGALKTATQTENTKKNRFYGYIIFAFSLGMVGISIE
jgi:O-antigen ligase